MPKKKVITNEQLVSLSRPQRNPKAKVVFDPSDVHVPKKRKKRSDKSNMNGNALRKSVPPKKNYVGYTVKDKSASINELLNASLNETVSASLSSEHSLSSSPIRYGSPEVFKNELTVCCMCSKDTSSKDRESVHCPICMVKAHSDCLIINEPMWRFKIDQCPWFCNLCRDKYCSKCHKVETQSDTFHRCITCKISLHVRCYESYDVKPIHKLKSEMYVCIPCMTLATEKVPEIEDEEMLGALETCDSSSETTDDDAPLSIRSYCSSLMSPRLYNNKTCSPDVLKEPVPDVSSWEQPVPDVSGWEQPAPDVSGWEQPVPDVSGWDKFQIFQYLSDRNLPEAVTDKIIKNDLDGKALLLLQRSDITCGMDLKLGPALKFYKEVRILQTKSTDCSSYWE